MCGEAAAATGTTCSACRLCPGWPAADHPRGDICDLQIVLSRVFAMKQQLCILAGNWREARSPGGEDPRVMVNSFQGFAKHVLGVICLLVFGKDNQ